MIAHNSDDIYLAIDGKKSPHSFNVKPSNIKFIENADIIFYIDDSLESSFAKSIANNQKAKKIKLLKEKGLRLYKTRSSRDWKKQGAKIDDKYIDSHIWLDTKNAKRILKIIKDNLEKMNPKHTKTYRKKYDIAIQRINALYQELELELEPLKNKKFIVFHDAFQYFENQFFLQNAGQITQKPHLNVSIKNLKKNKIKARNEDIKCIFFEPQFNKKFSNIIAKGSRAEIVAIDPVGMNLEPSDELYLKLMKNISKSYQNCLSDKTHP